ncbi:uroporphyrinogen-III C-methyltransferase [Anaerovorax odorimutans]|uniref:uroporphyrinogen-III C-methyltransferase n=1 Tax=Anaerovorax odorimutans TaxID=109327 RepID=A0ABT1RMG6_9FIRM|nr:uroporphyrinogen-III C-methyltransferase [Anaerovorax odorimutans]MCQ4636373.1 uroporphyrinogen-III C-methyltransferase [Anaerovorax odorimutans]
MTAEKKQGKVWLVGAGPSDAGLFTLKGKAVLETADVVVYDKLVGQGIMAMVPSHARKISVGKEAGHHPVPQHEINEILLREALAGNYVVRLKGGDPFLFGRGGEELELLCRHNIPFEVVPGITSALSVPAYGGIPVTHRDFCSSLHIITGHTKKAEEADVDYEALVRLNGTLVFLMGVAAMPRICRGLLEAGMKPDMPAAVLERGTTAHQRRVVATVSSLPGEAEKAGIKTPAVIVVGQVCTLERDFHWAEDRPLGTRKIAVTRPKDRSSSLAKKLQALGAEVVLMPTIETRPIADNRRLYQALEQIKAYSWIAFTSAAGVQAFYAAMKEKKMDIRSLAGIKIAVIGAGTRRAVEEKGVFADLMPEVYSGEALGRDLAKAVSPGERILLPRAAMGTEAVIRPLRDAEISFDDIAVYETNEGNQPVPGYDDTVDCVAFTSASTVRGFVKLNPDTDYSQVKAICIGEQTAAAAEKYGMQVTVSKQATIDSMIETILRMEP